MNDAVVREEDESNRERFTLFELTRCTKSSARPNAHLQFQARGAAECSVQGEKQE